MTTLIMVQREGDVELGWDSQMTRANEAVSLVAPKVFLNGKLIIGVTGLTRAADILETTEFPEFTGGNQRHWLIKEFVPTLRRELAADPYLLTDEGTMEGWGVMMVVDGQAFQLDSMFNPAQNVDGLYTMGSGGDYARGALMAGASLWTALQVAANIDPYTGGVMTVTLASQYLRANSEHGSAG